MPTVENEAYIARARELEAELQTMLLSQMEETAATGAARKKDKAS